jgi:dTDP-4-dehydrorhamnose 3,5-epimerase
MSEGRAGGQPSPACENETLTIGPTGIAGAYLVELEKIEDERGFFARTFCANEFGRRGLISRIAQCSVSFNRRAGTLRGMHFQVSPHQEARLVRCTRGAIYDVLLDLRGDSRGFGKWMTVELTAENRKAVYIPEGVAHGFQTLVDETEVFYQMSEFHESSCTRGVRWDDPAFGIRWPVDKPILSERDWSHALWK